MGVKSTLATLFYLSKLSAQSLNLVVKAKTGHRRAKMIFRDTLIAQGLHWKAAAELAESYPNPVNEILNLLTRNTAW